MQEQHASTGKITLQHEQLTRKLVTSFFRILRACGVTREELVRMASDAAIEPSFPFEARELRQPAEFHLACTDVVYRWRHDPKFLNERGLPMLLALSAEEDSFARLVRLAAPKCEPRSVLSYLEALEAVSTSPDGRLELATESVLACTGTRNGNVAANTVLSHLAGFVGSVEYNLLSKKDHSDGRFERACYASVPTKLVPVLLRLVELRGQTFVDTIDEWLARRRPGVRDDGSLVQVGAGAYVFINDGAGKK